MKVLVFLTKEYPERSKDLLNHIIKTNESVPLFLINYYSKDDCMRVGELLEESLVKRVLTRDLADNTKKSYLKKFYRAQKSVSEGVLY